MAVTFRYATHGEYPPIRDFLNDYWAQQHVYVRDPLLFDWTFDRRDLWAEGGYSFALAHADGELAGILGGIPFSFNCFGRRSTGMWIANYVVRPDQRKGSAALQLLSMFRRECFQPVIAFGINPATATIYRVLRGQVLPHIPRYVAVLPECVDRMTDLISVAHPDWPREQAGELAAAFRLPSLPAAAEAVNGIPEDWDTADWPEIAAQTAGAARDLAYLDWRYRRHPRFEYRAISISSGRRHGLLVWRLETIRRRTESGLAEVDRIGRIVEFLPVSPDNGQALVAALLRDLREAGALGADFYCYHGPARTVIEGCGFRPTDCHSSGDAIPSRFQPLDGKGGAILSAMFPPPGAPALNLEATCPWYWTKSDSDQDRPN